MTSTTIYHHATVFTAEPGHIEAAQAPCIVDAFAVTDGTFRAVGTLEEVRSAVGTPADEVDLKGAFVAPGIIDAHTHLTSLGEALNKVQLRDCRTLEQIQKQLMEARVNHPEAPRILGAGWLFDAVGDQRPNAAMIDAVVSDVPVYLDANDLHSVWVNSAALAELGIDRDSPDPIGGEIARDERGQATGMLYETAGRHYARQFLEDVSSAADHIGFLERAFDAYIESGVTGATDMALNAADITAIRGLFARDGRLPFPITGHVLLEPHEDPTDDLSAVADIVSLQRDLAEGPESPWFRVAGVKFILDGVIDACTATMRAPYADGSNADPIWSPERLLPVAEAADAAGLQLALHAIGDRTSEIALDVLEHCARSGPSRDRRHRVEHLETVTDATIENLAEVGATASMQPVHCDPAIMDNWMAVLGDHRQEEGFPWRKVREAGVHIALGTDAPTAPHEPLPNLYIALTGGSALSPGLPPYHPERAFTPAEALEALTAGAAYAGEMNGTCGRIRAGLQANFIVLDVDPLTADPSLLRSAGVRSTFVLGEELYEAARQSSQ